MKAWGKTRFADTRRYSVRVEEVRPTQIGERFRFAWRLLCPKHYCDLEVYLDSEERSGEDAPARLVINNKGGSNIAPAGVACEPTPHALAFALARTSPAYPPSSDGVGL